MELLIQFAMPLLFYRKKPLKSDRVYFFISVFAIATLMVLSFPGKRLFAAAETLSCNAGGSRTISVGTYTDSDGSQFSSGADLTLNVGTGSDCTFILNLTQSDSAVALSSLTIGSGVTLTHNVAGTDADTYNQLAFNITGTLTVDAGGFINVNGKGYLGGWQGSLSDKGRTNGNVDGSSFVSGGSHGGEGGGFSAAAEYDSIKNPTLPGGGGGGGGFGDSTTKGGNGGGVVRITAASAVVNGSISALGNGVNLGASDDVKAGGAGGTIYINVSGTLSGNGTIAADGGSDPNFFPYYGVGGGGRIALIYNNTTFNGTISAYGGNSGTVSNNGAAGTIFQKAVTDNYGHLLIDNNNNSLDAGSGKPTTLVSPIPASDQVAMYGGAYAFDSITVQNYGILNVSSDIDSYSDGTIDANRKLYASSCTADNDDLSDGEIQYNVATGSGVNADYTCVSPGYVLGFTSTSASALESVTSGSFNIFGPGNAVSPVTVDYAIKVASTTATGGGSDYTLSNGTATISAGESSTTIPFTIINDTDQESDELFVVELSNPIAGAVLGSSIYYTYTITDEDTPGITADNGGSLDINEGFGSDSYTLVLDSPPSSNVVITVAGDADVTPSPTSLTFTSENWNTPQTITVTAVDDHIIESSHTGTITHTVASSDTNYNNFVVGNQTANINDNDTAGITINSPGANVITENGVTDSYTIALSAIPTSDVTLSVNADADTSVDPTVLTFTALNWNVPQTVTVSAIDDVGVEGTEFPSITHSATSEDMNYMGASLNSASFTITDNDTASVTVTESGGSTSVREGYTTDTYTINLEKQPSSDVVITWSESGDLSFSPSSLTFTALNWLTPQTITITPVDDANFEGSEFVFLSHTATSEDSDYNNISINSLNFSILDNDGFTMTQSGGSTDVTEGGTTDSYTLVLSEDPFSDVTINLSTSTQYTLSANSLVFTSGNWSTPQTVTVTATDDATNEGVHTATITQTLSTFAWKYSDTRLSDVTVNITDNDAPTPGVTITESGGTTALTETGTTDSYTLVLDAEPTANVTITLSPDSDSTVSDTTLTFTTLNWDTPQTITVTAANDDIAEGDHTSTITHTATSGDADYNNIAIDPLTATITDNDTAGFTVSAISGNTTEAGGTATFTLVLTSEPTANVSIPVSSSDTSEGTVSPSTLTFTSGNWDTPQTVTVTGVDDFSIDGSVNYTIVLGTVTSGDANYNNANPNDVAVTNTDNDVAGFTISASSGNTSEAGGSATFTVVLDTEPTANVEIPVSTSDVTEGTPLPTTLTFTSGNWDTPQTVTVTGADDTEIDGTLAYTIILGNASSTDDDYDGLNPDDVVLSNTDNDVAAPSQQGGGSGTVPNSVQTIPFSEAQARIQDVVLTNDSPVVVRIGSVTHRITRVSATASRATIIIQSDPITLTLNKGETKTLDTDNDKVDDLEVTYLGIVGKNPEFTFRDLTNGKLIDEKRPFTINNNAKVTNERDVTLTFQVEKMVEMAISNTPDFAGSIYQPYVSSTSWKLSEGTGEKTVYVRFRNKAGLIAETKYSIVYNPQFVQLPSSSSCLYSGKAVKTANSPAVYLIGEMHDAKGNPLAQTCGKRLFPTSALYFSYFSTWKDIVVIPQSELDAISSDRYTLIPYGPRFVPTTGNLIKKVSDPKIYLVFGGQAHWIETEVVFKAAGLMFDWVKEVIGDVFTKTPIGSSIQDKNQIPKEIEKHDAPVVVAPTHSIPSVDVQAKAFNRFLGIGSSGEDVKHLQIILTNLGYFSAQPTGYFGPVTSDAVKAFQKDRGIDQKGHVGPATREALNSL